MSEPNANPLPPATPPAANAPVGPPPLPAKVSPDSQTQPSDRRGLRLAIERIGNWFYDDGCWYLGSAAIHAVAILSLGLIVATIPPRAPPQDATSFDAVESDRASPGAITRFEVGEAPLEPTELNANTLAMTKALPIASQEARFYDNSPEFEETGGSPVANPNMPKLGGLGGFSVKNLPGPGGRGGVGVGEGLGTGVGLGGAGEGFGIRNRGRRAEILGTLGGTKASERAVGAALNWLARHQGAAGNWSLDFRHQCKGGVCSGASIIRSDIAATAMALLPFLGAGQTHKSKGPYQQTIAKGLAWLIMRQGSDGDLNDGTAYPMYAQGLAAIALCEAYGLTKDEHVGAAARRAVAYIERAQNEASGGWRYKPKDPGDTSVFGWQIMALKSAQLAGIAVDTLVWENAQKWLRAVASGPYSGLYCYQPSREVTPTMTAVGLLCRQYMSLDPKDQGILEGKSYVMQNPPDESLDRNCYYWYYATLAMHNFADADWDAWNRKMRRVLIESQEKEGCATGSWDPDRPTPDPWGTRGGRLMMTSFNCLTLEVYYRYLPLFKTDAAAAGQN